MTTESEFRSDLDMREWAPEERLEFYRQYFFERRSAVATFDELPVDHRLHVVRSCLADMAALGWRSRSLGLIEDMARELERIEGGSNGGANNPELKAVLRGLVTAELLFVGGAERAAIPSEDFEPEALQPTLERVNDQIRAIIRECPLGGVYAADVGVEITLCYEPDGGIVVTYRVPFQPRRGAAAIGQLAQEWEATAPATAASYRDKAQQLQAAAAAFRPCDVCGKESAVWGPGVQRCADHFDFDHHEHPALRGLVTAELLFVGGAERAAIPSEHFEPEALQPTLERVNDQIRAIIRECPLGGVYAADVGVEITLCYEPDGGIVVTYRVPFRSRRGATAIAQRSRISN